MTCFFCKDSMEMSATTYFTDLSSCMVIIKSVPCYKCPQCGEKLELYQKVTGYLRKVEFFNPGKKSEFDERKQLNIE